MSAGKDRQSTPFPLRIAVIHRNRMTVDLLHAHAADKGHLYESRRFVVATNPKWRGPCSEAYEADGVTAWLVRRVPLGTFKTLPTTN